MNRLEEKRFWLAGGCLAAVLIAAIGWLLVISPQLSAAKTLDSEADSAQTQNAVLAARVAKLRQENDKVGQLRTSLRLALEALPFDTGLPALTRQLAGQATTSGVSLSSITVGSPIQTTAIAASSTTTTGTTGTGTATGTTGTGTTATTPATGTASAAVLQIPITLLSKGPAKAQLLFLKAIQVTGPRRALVSSTTLGGGSSIDKSSNMTTQLNVFLAPLSVAAQAQLAKLLAAK